MAEENKVNDESRKLHRSDLADPQPVDLAEAEQVEAALDPYSEDPELRPWREVWGALPVALDRVAPEGSTWNQIQARVQTDHSETEPIADDNVRPFQPTDTSHLDSQRSWSATAMRLAAVLIVGLMVTSAWLGNQVRAKNAEIALLQQQESLFRPVSGVLPVGGVPAVSATHMDFVAAVSVESCSLQAQGDETGARGWLYMGGADPSCLLAVEGLRPLAEGQIYRAWFRSQGRAIPMGVVEVNGERGEMFASAVPANVEAVFVTVEAAGTTHSAPQGPTVLYGDAVTASL